MEKGFAACKEIFLCIKVVVYSPYMMVGVKISGHFFVQN